MPPTLIAILFVLALAAINLRGVAESVKANVVLTLVEVSGLAVILAIGAYAVFSGEGEPSRLTQIETGGTGYALLTGVLGATALGFFAFVGFEDSVNMAEETKNPARAFPRAIFIGVGITGTVYVLVALVSSLLVDSRTLAESSGPLLEVVKAGGVDFPPKLFALIALFAVTNSALINIMMASRLCYGMANERILPPAMGKVLAGRRTPGSGSSSSPSWPSAWSPPARSKDSATPPRSCCSVSSPSSTSPCWCSARTGWTTTTSVRPRRFRCSARSPR